MLRLSSDLEVIYDPKGPRIDDIHCVAIAVGDIDQIGEAPDRGTKLSRMSFRVNVTGIDDRRHARQSADRCASQHPRHRPDSYCEQNRPAVSHLKFILAALRYRNVYYCGAQSQHRKALLILETRRRFRLVA